MNNTYYADTCGLLIGLVSAPGQAEEGKEPLVAGQILESYKKKRVEYAYKSMATDMSGKLYDPIGYSVLGSSHWMFVSLFDDFSFPNRVFHPFNGEAGYQNDDYQLVVGLNTMTANDDRKGYGLEDQFDKIRTYPFVCMNRFKVNSCFLCGSGLDAIELVKQKITGFGEDSKDSMHVLALNGFGNEELVALCFTDTLTEAASFTLKCRNLQIKDLGIDEKNEVYKAYIGNLYSKNPDMFTKYDPGQAHVFTSSYSLSGYKMERDGMSPHRIQEENCRVSLSWDVKPGHETNFRSELDQLGLREQITVLHVDNPVVGIDLSVSRLQENGKNFFETMDSLKELDNKRQHVRKLHITVCLDSNDEPVLNIWPEEVKADEHPCTKDIFSRYRFPKEELKNLRNNLDKSKVSKVLKERAMKMFHNYNDCIQDPVFFTSFVGLRHFLNSFIRIVREYVEKDQYTAAYFQEWIDHNIRDFERAYLNRFHQSSRTRALPDFNLEWNGGIQRLVGAMDFTYKSIMSACGATTLDKFMYVTGYERVHVTDHSYKINMQHITYPELFASTVWKEMFNFLMMEALRNDHEHEHSLKGFTDESFIRKLKNRISMHAEFNRFNEVHQIFLKKLDKGYMVSLMADLFAYYYGYDKDYELFSYWYWKYLMQFSMYFDKTGRLDKEQFVMFMGRVLFVKLFADKNVDELAFKPFDALLGEYWLLYFKDVKLIAGLLLELLGTKDFGGKLQTLVEVFLKNTDGQLDKDVNNLKDDTQEEEQPELLKKKYQDYLKTEILKEFEACKVPTNLDKSTYICSFLPAFLRYLRQLDNEGVDLPEEACRSLSRDENGKPYIRFPECYSNILSDPLGGFFCIDAKIQRKYFAARSILYLAGFDYYERNVIQLINP